MSSSSIIIAIHMFYTASIKVNTKVNTNIMANEEGKDEFY